MATPVPSAVEPQRATPARHAAWPAVRVMSLVVLVLMVVASVCGLWIPGLYRDPIEVAAMLRGYDLVTLVVVVPALALAILPPWSRNRAARVVWLSACWIWPCSPRLRARRSTAVAAPPVGISAGHGHVAVRHGLPTVVPGGAGLPVLRGCSGRRVRPGRTGHPRRIRRRYRTAAHRPAHPHRPRATPHPPSTAAARSVPGRRSRAVGTFGRERRCRPDGRWE